MRSSHGGGLRASLAALPWLAPAVVLILGVVLFPAGVMIVNSTRDISISGVDKGPAGFANYLAFIQLASIRLWLRFNESAP